MYSEFFLCTNEHYTTGNHLSQVSSSLYNSTVNLSIVYMFFLRHYFHEFICVGLTEITMYNVTIICTAV